MTVSATDALNLSNTNTLYSSFSVCTAMTSLDVSNWDLSTVTTLVHMFNGGRFTTLDVSNWDVSNVTTMSAIFYNCLNMTTLDVSNWDTSNLSNISYTLCNCPNLIDPDIDNWNIGSLTNASGFMSGTNPMSTALYDRVLIAWEGQTHNNNVTVHFGSSTYTAGGAAATARAALVADGWNITDGGSV